MSYVNIDHHCFQVHSLGYDMCMYLCYKMFNESFIILVFDIFLNRSNFFIDPIILYTGNLCHVFFQLESGEFFRVSLINVVAIIV